MTSRKKKEEKLKLESIKRKAKCLKREVKIRRQKRQRKRTQGNCI